MSNNKILVIDNYLNFLTTICGAINKYKDSLYNKYDGDDEDEFEKMDSKVFAFYNGKLTEINNQMDFFQNRPITDFNSTGIIVSKLNCSIKAQLLDLVKIFASNTSVDYHPGSNNKVRDLVHPSVYPYVKKKVQKTNKLDFWKRPYESSKYQWLPSEFKINADGKCTIQTYINNLPLGETQMYECIEKMFESVLPDLENAWSYANSIKIFHDDEDIDGAAHTELHTQSLKNKTLQVITKIVQVTLDGKETLPGSWHVEGMSHENIVGTASCTLDMDSDFEATLYFKRTYYEEEAGHLLMSTPQYPPQLVSDLYYQNLVPVGKASITDGALVVFPNNFVHKVDMVNKSEEPKTRTILVFWLINPNVRIKSTKDILQQTYDKEEVDKVRLELMNERTFFKQTFNQRKINLCEH